MYDSKKTNTFLNFTIADWRFAFYFLVVWEQNLFSRELTQTYVSHYMTSLMHDSMTHFPQYSHSLNAINCNKWYIQLKNYNKKHHNPKAAYILFRQKWKVWVMKSHLSSIEIIFVGCSLSIFFLTNNLHKSKCTVPTCLARMKCILGTLFPCEDRF